MQKYTIEEIVDAIDLSCGDSGKTSKEVVSILKTDVKKNTEDYLKEKTKKAIAELIKNADAFNKKEQLEEERKGKRWLYMDIIVLILQEILPYGLKQKNKQLWNKKND